MISDSTEQKFSWDAFVKIVSEKAFQYPALKVAYLAQCILESSSGRSELFKEGGNPTGIKWRQEMEGFATQLDLETPTEPNGATWCSWDTPEKAIDGYWRFIRRKRYQGWENYKNDPMKYIEHLVRCGYATDHIYIEKVTSLFSKAEELLGHPIHSDSIHSDSEVATWFKVDLSPDKKLILYAMASNSNDDISSLRSISKQELCDFLLKHSQAQSVRLSPQIEVISNQELQRIQTSVDTQASWFQFWRTEDNRTALLGMIDGHPCDVFISNDKAKIIEFLKTHPTARNVQGANLGAILDWKSPLLDSHHGHDPKHGSQDARLRPSIEWVTGCRNFSFRNGLPVDAIVLHYTTSRSVEGSISWFKNPASQVSAHYIVDRDGKIYQLVQDSAKAWHCYGFNTTSIGIEHVASNGDRLTSEQEHSSSALIRWLAAEYKISLERIYGHSWNPEKPGGTACPGTLWASPQELKTWLQQKVFNGTHPTTGKLITSTPAHSLAKESIPIPNVVGKLAPDSPFSLRVTSHITYGEICLYQERRRFHNQSQCGVAVILCQFLEKVRTDFDNRPLVITSGHRPYKVNVEQKGADNSEHLYQDGKGAIDFYIEGVNIYKVQEYCLKNWAHSVGRGAPRGFVHLGYGVGRYQWDY